VLRAEATVVDQQNDAWGATISVQPEPERRERPSHLYDRVQVTRVRPGAS